MCSTTGSRFERAACVAWPAFSRRSEARLTASCCRPALPPFSCPALQPAEVTAMAWSPSSLQLALGTARGTGVICSLATRATTPLQLGRSTKPVACMAWSGAAAPGGLLALACKGGALLLVRAADGCVARALQLSKTVATQLLFCEADAPGGGGGRPATATPAGCSLLAANLGGRSVGVWQLPQALAADHGGASGGVCELSFREGFGQLEQYCWLSRSLLLAGFSSGQLVAAAVALGGGLQYGGGTGAEVFSSRALDHGVVSLSWCPASGLLAAAGGGQLAVLRCCLGGGGEPPSLHQEGALLELERNQRVASVQASPCGRLLTLATASGRLLQLLASPPLLHGACGGRLAYVDPAASTAEARLLEAASLLPGACGERLAAALQLPCEPELLALGPTHLAAAQGNKVRPLACWARWTRCLAFFRSFPPGFTGRLAPYLLPLVQQLHFHSTPFLFQPLSPAFLAAAAGVAAGAGARRRHRPAPRPAGSPVPRPHPLDAPGRRLPAAAGRGRPRVCAAGGPRAGGRRRRRAEASWWGSAVYP